MRCDVGEHGGPQFLQRAIAKLLRGGDALDQPSVQCEHPVFQSLLSEAQAGRERLAAFRQLAASLLGSEDQVLPGSLGSTPFVPFSRVLQQNLRTTGLPKGEP